MNLLDSNKWTYDLPWGNIINPNTNKELTISSELVKFIKNWQVHFGVSNIPKVGWKRDENWNIIYSKPSWSVGSIIAKDEWRTHFGTYHFLIKLPNFRGSWPAIWLIDLHHESIGGMGIPPEIDIFEHFRKDSFLTRFGITSSFHEGPTYENNVVTSKKYWKFFPLDWSVIDIVFKWTPDEMIWIVNGKEIMKKDKRTFNFPLKPMNLIMGAGLGLDWNPKINKFEDFIIYTAEYKPLT